MASDRLFELLAQAKSQPDRWSRDLSAGVGAGQDILQGYLQGVGIKQRLQQPEALARLLNATPQGHEIVQTMGPEGATAAMVGSSPKDVLDYAGKSAELAQRGQLGLAGIDERNTASKRAFDAATARTKSQESMFGGRNMSSNIAMHENELQRLSQENGQLATKVPGGIGGTIQALIAKNADISQFLSDPRYSQIAAQMKANQQQIDFHKQVLQPMYRAQGIIPQSVLDNADLGGINPPSGGDNSMSGQGSTSGVQIF